MGVVESRSAQLTAQSFFIYIALPVKKRLNNYRQFSNVFFKNSVAIKGPRWKFPFAYVF